MYHLLTHNDLDGVGCGILAKLAFNDRVNIKYNSVASLNPQVERALEKIKKEDVLFITDLSVNEHNEKNLEKHYLEGGKVQLIDHHRTAEHLNQYKWAIVQVEEEDGKLSSATSLLYRYLLDNRYLESSQALDQFVELIRQYDTWEWDQNNNLKAKRLNDLFFLMSIEEFEEKMLHKVTKNDDFTYDEFEERILDMEEEKIDRYLKRKKREIVQTFIGEHCVGVVHAESYHSELGNELGQEFEYLDYIAILNVGGRRISLRTIHDHIDVSEIAAEFGGGGHAKASGCSLTENAYKLFVEQPFHIESIRFDAFRNLYNIKASGEGTLYENRNEETFFIYLLNETTWGIVYNHELLDNRFSSFKEAEHFIKRNYSAWLVRDENYVNYLRKQHLTILHSASYQDKENEDVYTYSLEEYSDKGEHYRSH
ncbi:DHH family phosphoesterase [Bacillus salitolerans]|uniref:DHH family phosphoesterase n=1 Tax=Bacillus salitolerans TaxID=1437434 RepID=A0ABW4LQ07_9BACI